MGAINRRGDVGGLSHMRQPSKPRSGLGFDEMLKRLEQGSIVERDSILNELAELAAADPNNVESWNRFAFALARAGRHADAVHIWEEKLLEIEPQDGLVRLNLAVSLSQLGHLQLARAHLARLAEHGAT